MRILKIVLSVLALLASAAGAVLTSGSPVQVSPATISFVMAIASGISFLGISPWQLTDAAAKSCSAFAVVVAGLIGWHASVVTAGANVHPWLWVVLGLVSAIAGVLGRSPIPHAQSAAARLDLPPPAGK